MTLRQRALGVLALLGLAGVLIGLPALLIALGADTLPRTVPSWDQVRSALLSPDDGTLALSVLKGLGWVVWAVLSLTILLEVAAQVSGARAPSLPGLRLPQATIEGVVATALTLFIAIPGFTSTGAADAAPSEPAPAAAIRSSLPATIPSASTFERSQAGDAEHPGAQSSDHPPVTQPADRTHLTQPGDTLWSIAEQYLGDGYRYPEIAQANPGLILDPDFLGTGWRLNVPSGSAATAPGGHRSYMVRDGDTLAGIAGAELGDSSRYGEIAQASRGITQPGGSHLQDPDLILTGWSLAIPTRTHDPSGQARTATADLTQTAKQRRQIENDRGHLEERADAAEAATRATSIASEVGSGALANATGRAVQVTEDVMVTGAVESDEVVNDDEAPADSRGAPWVLAGLTGAGVVLAGSVAAFVGRNRRAQFRARRPGRTIATTAPALAPVEKTLHIQGPRAHPHIEAIDAVLRELAAATHDLALPLPAVAAAQLAGQRFTVHLSEPAQLPPAWEVVGDPSHWWVDLSVAGQVDQHTPERPAPYPLLVTIGEGDDGTLWLLNLEAFGTVAVTGDPTFGDDFTRYVAAELACNPWAADIQLHCVNVAPEAARMNPGRVHLHDDVDQAAAQVLAETIDQSDRAALSDTTTVQGRADQAGEELWQGRVLLVRANDSEALSHLLTVVDQHPRASGTAVVLLPLGAPRTAQSTRDHDIALVIDLTSGGRVRLPSVGLDLVAAGLTADEAGGIAALLQQSTLVSSEPVPDHAETAAGTWRGYTDQAGALRQEYTVARAEISPEGQGDSDPERDGALSLLTRHDDDYVRAAATTRQDLAALAPAVTSDVREQVARADPTLDEDVAAWFAPECPLPRLTLLGPVKARTRGRAVAVVKSKDYYVELLAYLCTRPNGATMDEVTDVFNNSPGTVRKHISHLRDWLGINPRTGVHHLPDARKAPGAAARGVGVYQVVDVLVDADLFRRLRVRGQSRGPAGMDDLSTALRLVTGVPLAPGSLRPAGWSWVLEGDRLDQHLAIAVVDVAHLLATASLTSGDLDRATAASKTAAVAAPDEEIPRLDLAAIAAAAGDNDEAQRILTREISGRCDDDGAAPTDLPTRTKAVLASRPWPASHAS